MSTQPRAGRNDPCPCGSGEKFKFCCEGRHDVVGEARRSPWLVGGLAVVGIGVVATVAMQLGAKPAPVTPAYAAMPSPIGSPAGAPVPQPSGPAPAGKVWSPEHGHYHDAPAASAPVTVTSSQPVPIPPSTDSAPAPHAPAEIAPQTPAEKTPAPQPVEPPAPPPATPPK